MTRRVRRTGLTAQNAIPGCWRALLGEPDDILVTLLIEAVEEQSGIRPELEDVKAFLIEHSYAPPPKKRKTRPTTLLSGEALRLLIGQEEPLR